MTLNIKTTDDTPRSWHDRATVYDNIGIAILWFSPLTERFPDRLEEIAQCIFDGLQQAAQNICDEDDEWDWQSAVHHIMPFEDEDIMIIASWNDDLDMLSADADLAVLGEPVEVFLSDEEGSILIAQPIPASRARQSN